MAEVSPTVSTTVSAAVPVTKPSTAAVTVEADVTAAEKELSSWRINGWAALGLMIVANVVGALFRV